MAADGVVALTPEACAFNDLLVGLPIEVRWNPTQGRHLVAARDIAQGEVVLKALSYASTHYQDANEDDGDADIPPRARWCAGCLRFSQHKALPCNCSACGISFCSEKCKARATSVGIHSPVECCALTALTAKAQGLSRDGKANASLMVSVACRATAEHVGTSGQEPSMRHFDALALLPPPLPFLLVEGSSVGESAYSVFQRWQKKCGNDAETLCAAKAAEAALLGAGWVKPEELRSPTCSTELKDIETSSTSTCPSEPSDGETSPRSNLLEALLRIHSEVECNAFGCAVAAPDGAEAGPTEGWAVYPAASLMNHSCIPTLYAEYGSKAVERGQVVYRALHALPAGSPLTITYGRSVGRGSRALRRVAIREQWHFVCACERCAAALNTSSLEEGELYTKFDEEFVCTRCNRIGPSRNVATRKRPKGCSCLIARNRIAG